MAAKSRSKPKPRRQPADPGINLPAKVWRHSHGAMARLDALEETSKRILAAGPFPFHYTRRPAGPLSAISLAVSQGGVLLGPDGRPADLR